jgi:hypothetical protein
MPGPRRARGYGVDPELGFADEAEYGSCITSRPAGGRSSDLLAETDGFQRLIVDRASCHTISWPRSVTQVKAATQAAERGMMPKDFHPRKPPRFRISGVTAAVTILQDADILDLSIEGALVEHQDMLPLGSPCFLQLGIAGETLNIRAHVVHSRVSRRELGGALYYQTGLEFLDLSPGAEQTLGALIRSYGAREDEESRAHDRG